MLLFILRVSYYLRIAVSRYSLGKEVEFQEIGEEPTHIQNGIWAKAKSGRKLPRLPILKTACSPQTTEMCHDIDVCSFYISAPIFLAFNLGYWITYLNYDQIVLHKT